MQEARSKMQGAKIEGRPETIENRCKNQGYSFFKGLKPLVTQYFGIRRLS